MSLIQKVKKKRKDPRSKKMAGKKSKKGSSKRKQSKKSFSDGIRKSIEKVPIVGDVLKNKDFQKATQATGTVALLAGVASLVPNKTVQDAAQNPTVRAVAAFGVGDLPGAALQVATDRNILRNFSNAGSQNSNNIAGAGSV